MNSWDTQFETVVRGELPLLPVGEPLEPGLRMRDAGLTSMRMATLLVRLEEVYEAAFDQDDVTFEALSTPAALWDLVYTQLLSSEGAR